MKNVSELTTGDIVMSHGNFEMFMYEAEQNSFGK